MIFNFAILLLYLTLASSTEPPALLGQGLTRDPENGVAELNQILSCSLNGQTPEDLKWFTIKSDGTEEALDPDEDGVVKATDAELTYRCKVDAETYADFVIGKPSMILDLIHNQSKFFISEEDEYLLMFRVEKFERSYSVVEAEDLKIECKVTNRTSEIDIKNDVLIKWYMYNFTGDESTYIAHIGNCSEDQQAKLNWHEVIVDKGTTEHLFWIHATFDIIFLGEGEPHINMIESFDMLNKVLKIEDANRTTDRRAFKCVAYHREARGNCSESAFFVRVRDKYAALWPFLGIVSEVVVICLIIFICERRRVATAKDSFDDDDDDCNGSRGVNASSGNSNVRQRSNKN